MNLANNKISGKYSKIKYKYILQQKKQFKRRLIKKRLRLNNKKIFFLNIQYLKVSDYRTKLKTYNNYLKTEFNNILHLKKQEFKNINDKLRHNKLITKILWYNYLKGKKYLRVQLRVLALKKLIFNIRKITKAKNWKYNKFWIIRKKGDKIRRKKKIRLLFNTNLEINQYKSAYTIISKEFLSSSKFLKSKPLAFSLKVNKFIKYFF